ncbi:MAG: hypothetical protein LCH67_19690 [Bacteroidetes bacterium]|nr:hypothetical protein [Bacteroidota bacterium]
MNLDIEIEIGESDFKNQICKEINLVIGDHYSDRKTTPKFIIPLDFQEKVREISGETNYQASRQISNQSAFGITFKEKGVIILNSELFKNPIDTQIRANFYHHEYFHFIYEKIEKEYNLSTKKGQYDSFVNFYIEEYNAIRHGLIQAIRGFDNQTEPFIGFMKMVSEGHFRNLTNKNLYYNYLKKEISDYKNRRCTLEDLLCKIFPKIKSYTLDLISFDVYNEIASDIFHFEVFEDEFFNEKSRQFPRILENQLGNNQELYILDQYFKNFGITLKDTSEGLYFEIDFV